MQFTPSPGYASGSRYQALGEPKEYGFSEILTNERVRDANGQQEEPEVWSKQKVWQEWGFQKLRGISVQGAYCRRFLHQ